MAKHISVSILLIALITGIYGQTDTANLPALTETPGHFRIGELEVQGAVAGDAYRVNSAFMQRVGLQDIDAHFSITVPRAEGRTVTGGGGQILTIGYLQDGRAVEIIRFTTLTVPMVDPDERVRILADLLLREGPNMTFSSWDEGSFEGIYRTSIGTNHAVVLQGWVRSAKEGQYWVRLYGILNPNSETGILVFVLVDPELTGISPEQLTSQGVNLSIIHSLQFIE